MDVSKSIDFLLDKAGDVIRYRLHKEILQDLSQTEEENLLDKVMQTPHYRLLETYQKPNGYIGIGMHSGDKGKDTPLQDGEAAARLISYYAIPQSTPLVSRFAQALQDEEILEKEFSYSKAETNRFRSRFLGITSGSSLQLLTDTCLALMGYGDGGCIENTKRISYDAFVRLLSADSIEALTKYDPYTKRKYNYRYVEESDYYPCIYHMQLLSHTHSWKNANSLAMMCEVFNHINDIFHGDNNIHVKIGHTFYVPLWAIRQPIYSYAPYRRNTCYRRTLTDIVRMGIGKQVDVVNQSVVYLMTALQTDGIVRPEFDSPYHKRSYQQGHQYPTAYSEVSLEADDKDDVRLWCDFTFWAVQLLHLYAQ